MFKYKSGDSRLAVYHRPGIVGRDLNGKPIRDGLRIEDDGYTGPGVPGVRPFCGRSKLVVDTLEMAAIGELHRTDPGIFRSDGSCKPIFPGIRQSAAGLLAAVTWRICRLEMQTCFIGS